MRHNSDDEDISQPPARGRPLSQDTIPGAGRLISAVDNYSEHNQTMADDPGNTFSSEANINLTSWFVDNKLPRSQIDAYFADGLGGTDSRSFRST